MRLTAEVLASAPSRLNPVGERELCLRGLKAPMIENFGVTMDSYEAVDLTDNALTALDNFPVVRRLNALYCAHNSISSLSPTLAQCIPNLKTLVLTHNRIASLAQVEVLVACKYLTLLSFMHNPITRLPHYRLFVIFKLPQLHQLDFQRITRKERLAAVKLFHSTAGKALLESLAAATAAPLSAAKTAAGAAAGDGSAGSVSAADRSAARAAAPLSAFTPAQLVAIQEAIGAASTPAQIDHLEKCLKLGILPPEVADKLNATAAAVAADAPVPLPVS